MDGFLHNDKRKDIAPRNCVADFEAKDEYWWARQWVQILVLENEYQFSMERKRVVKGLDVWREESQPKVFLLRDLRGLCERCPS
jgi:hypothetical protein